MCKMYTYLIHYSGLFCVIGITKDKVAYNKNMFLVVYKALKYIVDYYCTEKLLVCFLNYNVTCDTIYRLS